ncbi:MAG: 50S ribosomal protein L6 [Oscillospiraceae bacterium]|nr:50S ribosomal protein L6 [Oscillospiraceae bacterium]MBP1567791.1 50S ribosomal protein L6 [Oscillospiraceae bacterium]MBR3024580.1 50S ribosomal protein L6 [Oscillospiraceae bacterium]MBR3537030.1 50S ribosomal protein L6 [Oscillospiraceae bacterium]MBR6836401.1 50S ribosomal protein L6 [Oscillospiraceae bacterium]
MSRIGRMPISVPAGVDVKIDNNLVTVKGSKGTISKQFSKELGIELNDGVITVTRPSESKHHKSLHGLTRTLISNMVNGVTNGYSKTLEIEGVGFRAAKQGKNLVMNLGFSHQVIIPETDGITIDVPSANKVIINGIDKQAVGQFAAEVREKRPPEPYKGKGIRYEGERIIRKEGKAGKGKK